MFLLFLLNFSVILSQIPYRSYLTAKGRKEQGHVLPILSRCSLRGWTRSKYLRQNIRSLCCLPSQLTPHGYTNQGSCRCRKRVLSLLRVEAGRLQCRSLWCGYPSWLHPSWWPDNIDGRCSDMHLVRYSTKTFPTVACICLQIHNTVDVPINHCAWQAWLRGRNHSVASTVI